MDDGSVAAEGIAVGDIAPLSTVPTALLFVGSTSMGALVPSVMDVAMLAALLPGTIARLGPTKLALYRVL